MVATALPFCYLKNQIVRCYDILLDLIYKYTNLKNASGIDVYKYIFIFDKRSRHTLKLFWKNEKLLSIPLHLQENLWS